jgi:prepilin-type N-terminal cleavage/methylation domain-containing protein
MFKLLKRQKGFTLIELMVVVAIIAILAAVVATQVGDTTSSSRESTKATDLSTVQAAVDRYYTDNSLFPWETDEPATPFDDTAVVATMLDEIDFTTLVNNDYLRSAPTHEATDPASIAASEVIDFDADGVDDGGVDWNVGGSALDLGSPWVIDNEGNVYCLIAGVYYGIDGQDITHFTP